MVQRKAVVLAIVAVAVMSAGALLLSLLRPESPRVEAAASPVSSIPISYDSPPPPTESFWEHPEPAGPPIPPVPEAQRLRIPVLMYHEIAQGPNNLYVAPSELAGHLDWLKENGYEAITLRQIHDHYARGTRVPPKPVVLTFDDGYTSYYENALPLLKQHGWPATLFVITGSVGERGHMTWEQVKEAAAAGTEIGSHTVNHPSLDLLTGQRLVHEIADSRAVLQRETGQEINFFCYPAGKYSDEALRVVRESGYAGAVTTKFGYSAPDQNPLRWERVRINKGLSPQGLGSVLQNAASRK